MSKLFAARSLLTKFVLSSDYSVWEYSAAFTDLSLAHNLYKHKQEFVEFFFSFHLCFSKWLTDNELM